MAKLPAMRTIYERPEIGRAFAFNNRVFELRSTSSPPG